MRSYFKIILSAFVWVVIVQSCAPKQEQQATETTPHHSLTTSSFGTSADGKEITRYTLTNANGMEMSVINYGGIITSLKVADKNGKFDDVVLGFDSVSQYEAGSPYFGALIGRYGNRIANGKFTLDGNTYTLVKNNDANHLHGGTKGFDKVYWNIEVPSDSSSLVLTYTSADGEEGYPGALTAKVTYTLTNDNEIKIDYEATTDKKTVVNLTNHSYFNLSGDMNQDILGHKLEIAADKFLPVDKTLIPTGELRPVSGTPFDFTSMTTIGARIGDNNEQLGFGGGYDHCWILNGGITTSPRHAATVLDSVSGRKMEVLTTEPAIQFYTGNFLDGSLTGKNNMVYKHRSGLCLETQHYPDSPNKPEFPSVVLEPGQTYKTTTIYKFSVE